MKVQEIDHICFAVRNLDEARKLYEDVLGMEPAVEYESVEESIRVIRYYQGGVAVELLEPMSADCEVARYIEKRGEGFFLISYRVRDVAESLAELKAAGHSTIDKQPRSLNGNRYAFIQPPREMHGVLVEIIDGHFIDPSESDK
jgi:methylmalonyl-CoA/ethylmalonyl-CoA epimerase